MPEHYSDAGHCDVLIIGAGISGIGVACRIRERNPQLRYRVLERRAAPRRARRDRSPLRPIDESMVFGRAAVGAVRSG